MLVLVGKEYIRDENTSKSGVADGEHNLVNNSMFMAAILKFDSTNERTRREIFSFVMFDSIRKLSNAFCCKEKM